MFTTSARVFETGGVSVTRSLSAAGLSKSLATLQGTGSNTVVSPMSNSLALVLCREFDNAQYKYSYLEVVEMHTSSSDWKRVIIIIYHAP